MSLTPPDLLWEALRDAAGGEAGGLDGLSVDDSLQPWIDLYRPVCEGGRDRPFVVGHLGQSLDGFIATSVGDSNFVTGEENIRHLHRLRALCDAVIVGAGTVAHDDPRLTTRLVAGASPLRVVIDPRRRLPDSHRIFCDGEAQTLRVSCTPVERGFGASLSQGMHEELLLMGDEDGGLDLPALLRALELRGCRRLFVEGGGETVSSFLAAGLLDRLHIAVAPLIIGNGRPAIRLVERERLGDCLRPPARIFRMGQDLLYDFDLRCEPGGAAHATAPSRLDALMRVY